MQFKGVIESQIQTLQVCKAQKIAGSKAGTQETQKIQKTQFNDQDSLAMNAQQSIGAQGWMNPETC